MTDRLDPDTGDRLPPGRLSRCELAEWLGSNRAAWQAWAFSRAAPPDGEWVQVRGIGWARRRGKGKEANV